VKTFLEFVKEFVPVTRVRRKGSLNPSPRDIKLLEKALTKKMEPYFANSGESVSVVCTIVAKEPPGWGECIKCELLANGNSVASNSVWKTIVKNPYLWSELAEVIDELDEDYHLTDEWKKYKVEGIFAVEHDLWGGL